MADQSAGTRRHVARRTRHPSVQRYHRDPSATPLWSSATLLDPFDEGVTGRGWSAWLDRIRAHPPPVGAVAANPPRGGRPARMAILREAAGRMLRACRDAPCCTTGRPFHRPPTLAFAALGGRKDSASRAPVLRATPTEVHTSSFCSSSSLRDLARHPIWAAEAARASDGARVETPSTASAEFQQPLQRLRHVLRDPDRLRLTTPSQYRDPAMPLPLVRHVLRWRAS